MPSGEVTSELPMMMMIRNCRNINLIIVRNLCKVLYTKKYRSSLRINTNRFYMGFLITSRQSKPNVYIWYYRSKSITIDYDYDSPFIAFPLSFITLQRRADPAWIIRILYLPSTLQCTWLLTILQALAKCLWNQS